MPLEIDAAPGADLAGALKQAKREGSRRDIKTLLAAYVPRNLAAVWSEHYGWTGKVAECKDSLLDTIASACQRWRVVPEGAEGYGRAEVTLGGIDSGELSPKTLEAKRVPGLFCIGEVLDVTGWLGGYNLQWAWSSGHAAGSVI